MAGLNDTDIKLDSSWQLTQAATGDAPLASGFDCVMQDIRLEAVSQEKELFYDLEWGWSLVDFVQSEDDDLTIIEIKERIRNKLERRETIDAESITIELNFKEDTFNAYVMFRFVSGESGSVSVSVDRINVEVTESD